jgi:hypothetical protein
MEQKNQQATDQAKALPKKSWFSAFLDFMGGDALPATTIQRRLPVILAALLFTLLYIGNGYDGQNDLVRIGKLQKELSDAKYKARLRSSELTEAERQSKVIELISQGHSTLQTPLEPPFRIAMGIHRTNR